MTGDEALPIVTLLLGGAIGWLIKRSETRRTEAIEAGDILSELPNYVWKQGGDDSWINLQVFLSRVRIRLRAAGVPNVVAQAVRFAAIGHWQGVYETDTDEGPSLGVDSAKIGILNGAVDDAQLWLFGMANPWKRHAAKKRHRVVSPPAYE